MPCSGAHLDTTSAVPVETKSGGPFEFDQHHEEAQRRVQPEPCGRITGLSVVSQFQMNLAAEVIANQGISGEIAAVSINERVSREVRATMKKEGATLPESLPIEPPISEVRKRLAKDAPAAIEGPKTGGTST